MSDGRKRSGRNYAAGLVSFPVSPLMILRAVLDLLAARAFEWRRLSAAKVITHGGYGLRGHRLGLIHDQSSAFRGASRSLRVGSDALVTATSFAFLVGGVEEIVDVVKWFPDPSSNRKRGFRRIVTPLWVVSQLSVPI